MTESIKNSVVYSGLIRMVQVMANLLRQGLFYRFFAGLHGYYDTSATKRLWLRFCEAGDSLASSRYGRILDWIGQGLLGFGALLRGSLFYRFMLYLRHLYESGVSKSLVFRAVNRLSLHQWLLFAFAFYLPLEYVIRDILSIGFLASVWEELFLLVAIFLVFWRRALGQSSSIHRATPLDAYLFLYLAVGLLLMSIVDPNPAVAFAGYRAQVEYTLWFFLIFRLVENDEDFRVIFRSFLLLGLLLSLHGIYQYIVAVPIPTSWVTQTEMGVRTRVFSLTGSPNVFGSLLVLLAPSAAAMIYYSRNAWQKVGYLALTGLLCLSLLFTFSRGAWVGLVIAVVLFSLYLDRRLLGLMGVAMAGVLALLPSITSRLTYLFTSDYAEASAIGGRAMRWETGRLLLTEHNPWFGFGLGRFGGAVAMNNKLLDETEEFKYFYLDNYYLKTMVEMGYIGIAIFLLLIAALLIYGLRSIHRAGLRNPDLLQNETVQMNFGQKKDPLVIGVGNPKVLAVGLFAGMVGVLIHCYFENIFEEPYMMAYFWSFAAMLLRLGYPPEVSR